MAKMEQNVNYSISTTFTNSNIVINSSVTTIPSILGNLTTRGTAAYGLGPMSEPMYKLGVGILLWMLPIIITIGTIGNILSFVVMLQREMRQTSTFFYLAALAVADTVVLVMSALKTWIRLFSGFEMLHISNLSCKVFMFCTYLSLHLSAWLIVAVTVERFIVVWFPLKATSICSAKRAKFTTCGIALGFFLLNVHLFWTAELITSPRSGRSQCAMSQNNKFLYHDVLPWVHLTLYSFLPFVSLLVFNVLIILSLVKHRQTITSQMTKDDRRTRYNHRKLAVTLLCISFVWMLTTTPSALYTVLPLRPQSASQEATLFFVKVICYIFMYVNHSINFFLYCITGQAFRRQLLKVMCRMCRQRQKPKPKLMFRASRSGSRQETTFPLMHNMYSGSKTSRSSSNSQSF